jgi:hypothetical protein
LHSAHSQTATRLLGAEGFFRKNEFRYDAGLDAYVRPAGRLLTPIRHGQLRDLAKVDYGNRRACRDWPIRARCTNDMRSVSRLENEVCSIAWPNAGRSGRRFSIVAARSSSIPSAASSSGCIRAPLNAWFRQRARRVQSLTALAYNLRRALNIIGVEATTVAVAAWGGAAHLRAGGAPGHPLRSHETVNRRKRPKFLPARFLRHSMPKSWSSARSA